MYNIGYDLAVQICSLTQIQTCSFTQTHSQNTQQARSFTQIQICSLNKYNTSLLQMIITLVSQILQRSYGEILRETMISVSEVLSEERRL